MKKTEIAVGGLYIAKVGNNITTVRVDAIREVAGHVSGGSYAGWTSAARKVVTKTLYDVTNMKTGRKTTFRSATKFRGKAEVEQRRPFTATTATIPLPIPKIQPGKPIAASVADPLPGDNVPHGTNEGRNQ